MTFMKSFKQFKKEQLRDPEFKKCYDALQPDYEIIKAILRARIEKGLNCAALACRLGIKISTLKRLELGVYSPRLSLMKRLAEALDAKLEITIK